MDMQNLLKYGRRCLSAKYTTVENNADYAIERDGNTVYLLFEWSDGKTDWKNNFDFPATPYKDMGIKWKCHRGFLKVWKSVEPYIKSIVFDPTVDKFIVVGYSHGAPIAALAHEYIWFNRPDLRDANLEGYGFGSPRCFFGFIPKELKQRWKNFYIIRNANDIVTHVPLVIMGFRHVGKLIKIGQRTELVYRKVIGQWGPIIFYIPKCVDAHRWINYEITLENYKGT